MEGSRPDPENLTHAVTREVQWYEHPAQAVPPNGTIALGTRCQILDRGGSYTRIWTEAGNVRGYVESSALRRY